MEFGIISKKGIFNRDAFLQGFDNFFLFFFFVTTNIEVQNLGGEFDSSVVSFVKFFRKKIK